MTITRPRRLLAFGTAAYLGGALFAGMGGVQHIAQGGSLEFVGNLISGVRDIRLDRLDPTYPRCF